MNGRISGVRRSVAVFGVRKPIPRGEVLKIQMMNDCFGNKTKKERQRRSEPDTVSLKWLLKLVLKCYSR